MNCQLQLLPMINQVDIYTNIANVI